MDALRFFNLAGNTGVYQETTAYIPGVVLGSALPGMQSIGRPDADIYTGFRVEKDADNYQLWLAQFNSGNAEANEWYASDPPLLSVGTLTYGDTVAVTAVPIAEMLTQIVGQIDYDAAYPVIVTASSYTLTPAHHDKIVVFQNACSVSIDTSYSKRQWCAHLVQGGTGQITLAADTYNQFNSGGNNTAYQIANSRYKKTLVMRIDGSNFMVVQ